MAAVFIEERDVPRTAQRMPGFDGAVADLVLQDRACQRVVRAGHVLESTPVVGDRQGVALGVQMAARSEADEDLGCLGAPFGHRQAVGVVEGKVCRALAGDLDLQAVLTGERREAQGRAVEGVAPGEVELLQGGRIAHIRRLGGLPLAVVVLAPAEDRPHGHPGVRRAREVGGLDVSQIAARQLRLLHRRLLHDPQPEQEEPVLPDHRDHRVVLDVELDLFPRRPVAVLAAAVEILAVSAGRAGHHVGDVILRLVGIVLDVVDATRLQFGDLLQLGQVVEERHRCPVFGDVALQQLAHGLLEEGRLVVAQLGLQPVLRVEEDLAVGLPDPVAAHPRPVLRIQRRRRHPGLQVHQATFNKELH